MRSERLLKKRGSRRAESIHTINITLIYIAPCFCYEAWLFHLNDKQVETIKDAMTYNLFHIRYDDFMDLLPNLTESDKNRVYHWLVEAREFSMDFETPRKMRQMFTKYRGRINNYLSSRGYDLRKATEEQEARKMKNK